VTLSAPFADLPRLECAECAGTCLAESVAVFVKSQVPGALLIGAVLLLLAPACYVGAEPAYVTAQVEPAHVHTYPRTYYEGRPVYLIDGRWYFQERGRWVYYREEPDTLDRERTYIEQAPRAPSRRRYYDHYKSAPRAPQSAPRAPQSAPRAPQPAPRAPQSAPRAPGPSYPQSAPPAHRVY
jgi:hypothetical protein